MRTAVRRSSLGLVLGLFLLGIAAPSLAADAKGWLGVRSQNVSDELRDALDFKGDGVLVNQVVAGGPAERAGIQKGDIITAVNGRAVKSPDELAGAIQGLTSGATANVKAMRRGSSQAFNVKLGTRPETQDDEDRWSAPSEGNEKDGAGDVRVRAFKNGKEVDPGDIDMHMRGLEGLQHLDGLGAMPRGVMFRSRPRLGVRLEKMNPDLAGYFGGTNGRGALVIEVIGDTPAEKAGIKAGDVIIAVGKTNVESADDLVNAIADDEGKVSLTVVRKGVRKTIEADLGDAPRNSMTWRMRDGRAPRALRTPEAPEMMRNAPDRGAGDGDVRREIQELRDELREMKKQLETRNR